VVPLGALLSSGAVLTLVLACRGGSGEGECGGEDRESSD
jgi:hypothetical protein